MLLPYDKNKAQLKDFNECVELMRGGSKTFFAASRLLPKRVRQASVALYAFCRVADDLVDNTNTPSQSLEELQKRLDTALATPIPVKSPVKIVSASPALEKRVRELESERDKLAKKLKALTDQSVDRLAAYRNARATTPRERVVQFHAERQK
jgi:phytoene/squalene synthetase